MERNFFLLDSLQSWMDAGLLRPSTGRGIEVPELVDALAAERQGGVVVVLLRLVGSWAVPTESTMSVLAAPVVRGIEVHAQGMVL